MRKPDTQPILRFHSFLSKLIPVISQRSLFKYKIRLYINYFMQSILLVTTMISICFPYRFDIQYLQYALLGLRFCLYMLCFKLNVIDVAIITKAIIIFNGFSKVYTQYIFIEGILLGLHLGFAFVLALSCEQRRGDFDERLGVKVPYMKQAVVVICAFFVHAIPNQFINIYYPTLLFALFHTFLCFEDQLYNFYLKQILQGVSLLGLTVIAVLATLNLTLIDRDAIMMMGTISYFILFAWFLNRSQFHQFKILEQNPNSFAEWDYQEYFQKLIYLIKEKEQQCNEEILRGFYKSHHYKCFSSQCPIRYCKQIEKEGKNDDVYFELELEIIIRYIQSFLRGQLEIATIKYPNLKRFYIFYTSPSLEALRYCDKTNFIEFREAERIEIMFQSKDIQFQRENSQLLLNELKVKMEEYINSSNHMWRLLYDENVDLQRLQMIGTQLLQLKQAILKYQKYTLVDVSTLKLIKDFKQYILEEKVDKSLKYQQESTSKLYNFIEIHTKQQPILIISAEPETLQRIQNVNASSCRLIGYSKKELLSRKLNDILPDFIGTFHTILLTQRSKELLYESEKKLQTLVYIVQRSGYVFESSLRILQLNSIKGRRWSCILSPTNQPNILVITNGEGQIQGLTSNAYSLGLDLNILGKLLCPKIFQKLLKKPQWRNTQNYLQHLFEKKQDAAKFKQLNARIKLKSSTPLIPPTKIMVFQIDIDTKSKGAFETKFLRSDRSMKSIRSKNDEESCRSKHRWTFNFPNTYSNYDMRSMIDIKEKKEQHYEFVNFGEGIHEMRYLNGEIQYKQDKTESSFEKQQTEGSLVQIIEFNMKKEIYTDLMGMTKTKLPKCLIEFSVWVAIAGFLIIGAMTVNFLIFYLGTLQHKTYAYVSSNFNHLRFQYSSITHSAIELAYMSYHSFTPSFEMTIQNITDKLTTISTLSPLVAANQSYINTYSFNTELSSSNSFYDILSEFKLQSSNILNSNTTFFDFQTTSPVYKIMNLSINYINKGHEEIVFNLLEKYKKNVQEDYRLFMIIGISLVGVMLLICLRVYFIVRGMNRHKMKLMSIYLEIEQSTIKKIQQRNNTFKAMLKYNLQLDRQDQENEEIINKQQDEEKEAKKRIKSMNKHNYFFIFFVFVAVCVGIFAVNSKFQTSYRKIVSSNLEQIVYFSEANFVDFDTYSLLNYVMVIGESKFNNMTVAQYLSNQLMNVYRTQMKFRKMTMQAFNSEFFSPKFASFFMDFWFRDACRYFTNPNCRTDFTKVLNEGGDKYWIVFTLTMDAFISIVNSVPPPLPPNLYIYLAPFLEDIRKALKFYGEDILMITYQKLLGELILQINEILLNKVWVFGSSMFLALVGLILYFSYFLKRMRVKAYRVEEIIGLIPYSKLSTIIEFKKYIRKKFAEEDT